MGNARHAPDMGGGGTYRGALSFFTFSFRGLPGLPLAGTGTKAKVPELLLVNREGGSVPASRFCVKAFDRCAKKPDNSPET